MTTQINDRKYKRLSPSQRIHIRRLKQAARSELLTYHPPVIRRIPVTPTAAATVVQVGLKKDEKLPA